MELLIISNIISLVLLAILSIVILILITHINERSQLIYGELFTRIEELEKNNKGYVTDPFEKPKEKFSSTSHVIQRKTPDQIRNENYSKIVKEGKFYGKIN